MSRHNKVNPAHYTIAGRLTPDDLARERRKQATTSASPASVGTLPWDAMAGPKPRPKPPARQAAAAAKTAKAVKVTRATASADAETADFVENARAAAERRDAHWRPSRVDRGARPEPNPHPSLIGAGTRAC